MYSYLSHIMVSRQSGNPMGNTYFWATLFPKSNTLFMDARLRDSNSSLTSERNAVAYPCSSDPG